ncbi:uncharacterized protein yc1106_09771 [Curvularia clavata]|uniref:Uncharacterized protein n=1 Tax=Curvularia clavata TaxID=95742 RepID=A0A9Q8ZFN0_CURCL|nr:uncharacterized protein yc1106_09771 [Curvularia clavata]
MLMFLPPELLTLVVLGTAVVAFPLEDAIPVGDSIATNATATTSADPDRFAASETPAAPDEEINLCIIDPNACGHREIPELPTATGFDDTEVNSFIAAPTSQANVVVTSNIPTIIDVHINTAVRGPAASFTVGVPVASLAGDGNDAERNMGQPNTAVQKDIAVSSDVPKQPVVSPAGMIPSTVVLPNPQQTSQNSLLLNVVSRLGQTGSVPQPTSSSSGTTDASGKDSSDTTGASGEDSSVNSVAPSQKDGITPGPGMPSATSPSVIAGNSITLGSAVLTLTPGISTTIGPNSDQTFIAITTNVAGSTLVTISSSGTAVTATVSTTPTVLTLSKTGFEASITHGAGPERYTGKLSTTTSSGLAVENRRSEVGWWTSAILGFLPIVFGF